MCVDDPTVEKATVLPSASFRLLIGESAGTYRYVSLAPVMVAPMMRMGAPLA